MSSLSVFAENVIDKSRENKKFLQFIITNNKPLLSELILSEFFNNQLKEKSKNIIKLSAIDHVETSGENKIFFNLNKSKTNNQFLIYDILINTNKREENLYEFENRSENIKEKLSQKKMENLVCLQVEQKNKENILEENVSVKIQNTKFILKLIKKFGFDWLFKENFIQKINFFNNSNSFYNSIQLLKDFDKGFKFLFSNQFVKFTGSRSENFDEDTLDNLNFYANSESFLNFFDENKKVSHIVKLNVGEQKFQEAIQKLDTLCLEKKLLVNKETERLDFVIQSGVILLRLKLVNQFSKISK